MEATYDFVIVGGGTAGLTLASRLSENPQTSVAVIEAGSYYQITNPLVSSTPVCGAGFAGSSPKDTNPGVDWGFVTAPQIGADNRELHYPRGKCLGGTSGRNLMMYQRPDEGSLQQWADMVGDQSYNFKNMLPYFQKSCKFTPPDTKLSSHANVRYNPGAFVSSGGPLQISYPNNIRPFSTYLGSAFNEIGIPDAEDFNSGELRGSQFCTVTIDPSTAIRSSSQTAFLDTCQARPNIKIFRETLARKISFDKQRVTGVHVDSGLFLRARKEVILCAGAFQSPQLLMVSGIGPAATLNDLDIPIIADRPGVGQNMTDHVMFGPSYRVKVETLPTVLSDPQKLALALNDYFRNAQGPLASQGADYVAWEKVPKDLVSDEANYILSKQPASWPDLEYFASDSYFGHFSSPLFRSPEDGYPADGYNYASICVSPVAPRSRGSVTIKSADVTVLPVVNPKWLTDPIDVEVAIAGYKRARAVFATDTIKGILADPIESFPGPAVQTDEELLALLRKSVTTVFHASTTCRMGKPEDPDAVVDSKARVIGVSGLRVVDTSSFALLPPGHPQSTVYAFAEKIADDIKGCE
ncbi:choline dehydrogenase [Biscogniauxia mediterranea]|nr:choline dehydrogenase [Biscogniauxia mediterranea]